MALLATALAMVATTVVVVDASSSLTLVATALLTTVSLVTTTLIAATMLHTSTAAVLAVEAATARTCIIGRRGEIDLTARQVLHGFMRDEHGVETRELDGGVGVGVGEDIERRLKRGKGVAQTGEDVVDQFFIGSFTPRRPRRRLG